jgi:hypothetical protein
MVKDNHGAAGYDYVKVVVNGSSASVEMIDDPETELASILSPVSIFPGAATDKGFTSFRKIHTSGFNETVLNKNS